MARKMLNCKEVGLRLQSYLDGELDEKRMEQIRAHLEDCVNCGLEFDAFQKIKRDLTAQSVPADSAALARLREFSEQIATRAAETTQ